VAVYPVRRAGLLAGSVQAELRIEGSLLLVSGDGREISIDLVRESHRVQFRENELLIDMMRFSAPPEALAAVREAIRLATASAGPAPEVLSASAAVGAPVPASPPRALVKSSYAAKFSTYGGVAGLIAMFLIPSGGSLLASALIGMVCGAGGSGLGTALGSFLDALAASPSRPEEPAQDRSALSACALVLGVAGLVAWLLPIAGIPIGIAGVVCGRKAADSSSRKMALTGMALSLVCLLLSAVNGFIGAALMMRAPR
jgi:hypothetical protein